MTGSGSATSRTRSPIREPCSVMLVFTGDASDESDETMSGAVARDAEV